MADIEKVKQGLRCIAQIGECDCDHCDYADNGYPSALYKCQEKFASDALSMIEQMEQRIKAIHAGTGAAGACCIRQRENIRRSGNMVVWMPRLQKTGRHDRQFLQEVRSCSHMAEGR